MIAERVSVVPAQAVAAVREGAPIEDGKLQALASFTACMVRRRGNPGASDVEAFLGAGFMERHILGIVLAIAVKTISNYSNHLFHTPLDAPFAAHAWSATR